MSDDNSSSIELNRRRVLGALGTVGVASAGAGAGTFALFSDTESSTGNSVQAGTLDLTADTTQSFNASATNLSPGGSTNTVQVELNNVGSVSADHVELSVDYSQNDGSEPSDDDLSANVTAQAFAERLFASTLDYAGSGIGLGPSAFQTFTSNPEGAAVVDIGGDGSSDVELSRVPDPAADGSRQDVVRATSNGTATNDYALSIRDVGSISITNIAAGDITFDYYAGTENTNAPDEVFVLLNDSGTNRLVSHTGNKNSPDATEQWETRDVGGEIAGADDSPGANYVWKEIAPNNTTYSKPSNGGLYSDLPSATIEAVGFGRGTTGGGDTIETYYDNLVVDGTNYKFRPVSLDDIASRGVFDSLVPISGTRTFEAEFELDRLAGNDFQGDGVDISFTFGLAQESGQSVL